VLRVEQTTFTFRYAKESGMSNACSNPFWSNHCHRIVSVIMLVERDPWNLFMILSSGVKLPMKWTGLSEVQAVQRLSIIVLSVSKLASLLRFGTACDSIMIVATKALAAATDTTFFPWRLDIGLAMARTARYRLELSVPLVHLIFMRNPAPLSMRALIRASENPTIHLYVYSSVRFTLVLLLFLTVLVAGAANIS
jgi:hypothetical protein